MNRKIAADWVFPVSSPPLRRGILHLDEQGKILEVEDTGGLMRDTAGLEYYNGILIPGFVNCHCHLELSYLRGCFPMHTGLPVFIRNITRHQRPEPEEVQRAIKAADRELWDAGVQAVGDISNNSSSFEVKVQSKISYNTFVEIFDLAGGTTGSRLEGGRDVLNEVVEKGLPASLVPHAPYTVSAALMREICMVGTSGRTSRQSIHNQETASEDSYMKDGSGELGDLLREIGARSDPEMHGRKSSPEVVLPFFEMGSRLLLVHNTYTGKADIDTMKKSGLEINLVLCPNANQYIENRLPDIELLASSGLNICLGTDSLASNNSLSVLDEMKTISRWFPDVSFSELLRWATLNGARALGMEELGCFERGMKPGVLLLEGCNLEKPGLGEKTIVKRIV
jgi:cytosine/adenosine deaminase-related metal-dependent hydrolase